MCNDRKHNFASGSLGVIVIGATPISSSWFHCNRSRVLWDVMNSNIPTSVNYLSLAYIQSPAKSVQPSVHLSLCCLVMSCDARGQVAWRPLLSVPCTQMPSLFTTDKKEAWVLLFKHKKVTWMSHHTAFFVTESIIKPSDRVVPFIPLPVWVLWSHLWDCRE